jgi:hypothetical protein
MGLNQTVRCGIVSSFLCARRPTMEIVTFLRARLFHKMFHVETFRSPTRRGHRWLVSWASGCHFEGNFWLSAWKVEQKDNALVTGLLLLSARLATSVTVCGWQFQSITPKSVESWEQR